MKPINKTKLQSKILDEGLFLVISFSVVGQADSNNTKDCNVPN